MKELKIPSNIIWKELIKVDPGDLPLEEELAYNLFSASSEVEIAELDGEDEENMVHLFRVSHLLMKTVEEVDRPGFGEVTNSGEGQAKLENQLKTEVMKLEDELESAVCR